VVDTVISVMEPDVRSGTTTAPVAPVARGGIVSRRGLLARLRDAGRVTVVSAPAGSGKTFLLRSWIAEAGLAGQAAWVPVQGEERDPQRFWISVADALRGTAAGAGLVRPLTAAPGLDGWAVVEHLLEDLALLTERVWLVIDDLHELGCEQTVAQLESLVQRAPARLRFVLAARHDFGLGLHRLRLEGELTEIRGADLRFSPAEAGALFAAAGIELPGPVLALLAERTEGWAAGLRLAALSLARHPDPGRFAAEFCGSDRMVAEYLLAEVLERQAGPVQRFLLRTSILERVNGELADLLTGGSGGERVLQDLEQAGAFVVPLDMRRSWFRYHRLFADLLQLELRRAEPGLFRALHGAAAGWFAGHGHPVEAIRHAQAAHDWDLAVRLLADHEAAGGMGRHAPPGPPARGPAAAEPLTDSETRVLAYLPTHLTASEIAGELYVSVTTVKTHMSHLYAKLGSHRRAEAVDRARALGLLTHTLTVDHRLVATR
jgi:LuxR family maltose regulon positive regulatory protein